MPVNFQHLIKDITKIDVEDICSEWRWLLEDQKLVTLVSSIGDMFLIGKNNSINWLDTGTGELKTIADDIVEFKNFLSDFEKIENWFLASTIEALIERGLVLNDNQVYSYKTIPALGGDYSLNNFEKTDISVHFSITGQIHKQIKDLPAGTPINKIIFKPFTKS